MSDAIPNFSIPDQPHRPMPAYVASAAAVSPRARFRWRTRRGMIWRLQQAWLDWRWHRANRAWIAVRRAAP